MKLRRLSMIGAVGLLVCGAGCRAAPDRAPAQPKATGTQPSATVSASAGPARSGLNGKASALRWRLAGSLDVMTGQVSHVQVDDSSVVFAYAERAGDTHTNAVGLWDGKSDNFRDLASTRYPGGVIDWAEIDGDQVVFVDIDRVGTVGSAERVQWQIRAIRTDGTREQVLAESPPSGTLVAPLPESGPAGFGWVLWQDNDDPFAGRRVYTWRPGSRVRLVRQRVMVSDRVVPTNKGMLFRRVDGTYPSGNYVLNAYLWDRAGGPRLPIVDSGLLLDIAVNDHGRFVWAEYHPRVRTSRTSSLAPHRILVGSLDDAPAVEVQKGWSSGNLSIGEDWVAWHRYNGGIGISTLDGADRGAIRFKRWHVPAGSDGDDHHLVFAQRQGPPSAETVRLNLVTITAGH